MIKSACILKSALTPSDTPLFHLPVLQIKTMKLCSSVYMSYGIGLIRCLPKDPSHHRSLNLISGYFVCFSTKPSFSYNGLPESVAESSRHEIFIAFASLIAILSNFVAIPLRRYSGYVNTFRIVAVLPVMQSVFAGFSAIAMNTVETA